MEEVSGPFAEARAKGALRMSRGEGLWWDPKSDAAYIVDTSFGVGDDGRPGRGLGGIWAYRPDRSNPDRGTLTLVYAAAARVAGNNPDNIAVSPRGGLLTVDDGEAIDDGYGPGNRIMAYRADGLATIFGKNSLQLSDADLARIGRSGQFPARDYRGSELCGACFSPDGDTLLVNIQNPGVTLAIRGPWARGML
jgi:secreted PhoX family phosphatase